MTDQALIAYYTEIADLAVFQSCCIAQRPFANDVTISADVVRVLADHPNIHGIKDTSKNMMNAYMDAAGGRDDFEVMSGSMSTVFTCMDRGWKRRRCFCEQLFPGTVCGGCALVP